MIVITPEHSAEIQKRMSKRCRREWFVMYAENTLNDLPLSLERHAKYGTDVNARFLRSIIEYRKFHNQSDCEDFWKFYVRTK